MGKLTASLVEKKCSQNQAYKTLTKELGKQHLKKMTHLFMSGEGINEIGDFSLCKNLRVIYLQRNVIEKIENLDFAINVTHLYLQHNCLTKIENLESLVNLKKLYLGYNRISVIEGLENQLNLTDLHVEKQQLGVGERLCFDPRCAKNLSNCLLYLNVSSNKLISLSELNDFRYLITLEAKDNSIENIGDLSETVTKLVSLENLYLQGNPVTKIRRYRENLVANSSSLNELDGKRITDTSRTFLKKFKSEKLLHSRRKVAKTISEDITSSLNLPPAFERSVSRAIFQNINPKFTFPGTMMNNSEPQIFPAWRSISSIRGNKDSHNLPRPFWRSKSTSSQIKKKMSDSSIPLPAFV
ncbi:hypothetical protein QAD02_004969 [Eretmocerus hayati]|uniref:Uncharacterized protein n=1 Tax=Eretmocerus hayati TaxID=131215 RepID=A0ACC2NTZ3_9HYME|nr:hypothetical protein QAD02_004969 [Eretmocerus hayati]